MRRAARGPRSGKVSPPRSSLRSPVQPHFAKGSAGRKRPAHANQRRVVVKARFVNHMAGKAAILRAHIAYLARESARQIQAGLDPAEKDPGTPKIESAVDYLSREKSGGGPVFYNADETALDGRAVAQAWHADKRHFRLIISAEDGADLGELRPFIRETMTRLELRVGTRLQWLAVDHWDTDNPHSHVLVRGVRSDGKDLIIPRKIISVVLREDAQEIATRILGPRPELALDRERSLEVNLRGFGRLDLELRKLDGPGGLGSEFRHTDLMRRLEKLEGWGLASVSRDGSWRIIADLPDQLHKLADVDEVDRVLSRQRVERASAPTLAADGARLEAGRLLAVSQIEDGSDNLIAIIETGRGERRYARFHEPGALAVLDDLPQGAIVAFEPREARIRPADEAIARVARMNRGLYSADIHTRMDADADPGLVGANIRRLEAMRRAGLVTRGSDGIFDIAPDHLDRVLDYERIRIARAPVSPRVLSYWTLDNQIEATGPTYLDRMLAGQEAKPPGSGLLAQDVETALRQRRLVLIEAGVLGGANSPLTAKALEHMAARELHATIRHLSEDTGMPVSMAAVGETSGVYGRRIDLAQGRVALIMGQQSSQLVPWRPKLERFAGREVVGHLRGRSISWSLKMGRGVDLPPM